MSIVDKLPLARGHPQSPNRGHVSSSRISGSIMCSATGSGAPRTTPSLSSDLHCERSAARLVSAGGPVTRVRQSAVSVHLARAVPVARVH